MSRPSFKFCPKCNSQNVFAVSELGVQDSGRKGPLLGARDRHKCNRIFSYVRRFHRKSSHYFQIAVVVSLIALFGNWAMGIFLLVCICPIAWLIDKSNGFEEAKFKLFCKEALGCGTCSFVFLPPDLLPKAVKTNTYRMILYGGVGVLVFTLSVGISRFDGDFIRAKRNGAANTNTKSSSDSTQVSKPAGVSAESEVRSSNKSEIPEWLRVDDQDASTKIATSITEETIQGDKSVSEKKNDASEIVEVKASSPEDEGRTYKALLLKMRLQDRFAKNNLAKLRGVTEYDGRFRVELSWFPYDLPGDLHMVAIDTAIMINRDLSEYGRFTSVEISYSGSSATFSYADFIDYIHQNINDIDFKKRMYYH